MQALETWTHPKTLSNHHPWQLYITTINQLKLYAILNYLESINALFRDTNSYQTPIPYGNHHILKTVFRQIPPLIHKLYNVATKPVMHIPTKIKHTLYIFNEQTNKFLLFFKMYSRIRRGLLQFINMKNQT